MNENPYKSPSGPPAGRQSSTDPNRLQAEDYVAILVAVLAIAAAFYGMLRGFSGLDAALSN